MSGSGTADHGGIISAKLTKGPSRETSQMNEEKLWSIPLNIFLTRFLSFSVHPSRYRASYLLAHIVLRGSRGQ